MSDPAILYKTVRIKRLGELLPSDIPRGVDPDDLATDLDPNIPDTSDIEVNKDK